MLTAEEAAEYVDCISATQFRREVAQGVWPGPLVKHSRPMRWSRIQIDAALQPLSTQIEAKNEGSDLDKALGLT
ncbi:MAG: hypothetical protein HQL70_10315 [Magnetococcales bacterium]|nr:hypothetical protein [Magnetococcales bacterium]